MLRVKRPFGGRARTCRTLRMEPLEQRTLLSAGAAVSALPVHPVDSSPVITLGAIHSISDVWTLRGAVTDGNYPVAGLHVEFGGTLARFHLSATVQANGTYSVTEILTNVVTGTATAQTHDFRGKASNVAMTYILNDRAGLQSGVAQRNISAGGSALAAQSLQSINTTLDLPLSDAPGEPVSTISTVAGASGYRGDGGLAADASLYSPQGVAVGSLGNLYIADTDNNVVREVNCSTGVITTVAGNGVCGYQGDRGAAIDAELNAPVGVAADAAGDLFIADAGNDVIRMVDHATGVITTVAGSGVYGYGGDGGAAASAELGFPSAVAVDGHGRLFIADSDNNVVREVDLSPSTPTIATVAGNYDLGSGYSGDGSAAAGAQLSFPAGVAVDAAGDLFIADSGNNVVREVDLSLSTPTIATVAGNYGLGGGYSGDGYAATSAQLSHPSGVAVGGGVNLLVADSSDNVVREVNLSTGCINTVAGNGTYGYEGDGGAATRGEIGYPTAVAVDAAGDLFISDSIHNGIREVAAATGRINTVAGNGAGNYSGDGSAASSAELYGPMGVAVDAAGDLFVADSANNVVRAANLAPGVIATVAGDGGYGYGGDGLAATSAALYDPMGVAADAAGDLFIADTCNNVVRKVAFSTGVITTIAGNSEWGFSGDGLAATSAELDAPTGVAVAAGCLFIADSGNNVVREVNLSTGIISTVAGNYDLGGGYGGDGSAATSAQLDDPTGVAVDGAGDLFIADTCNNVVRKVNLSTGIISTVAGKYDLGGGYGGDGSAAASAELDAPTGVAVAAGCLFIADSGNNVIRKVDAAGVISTVAGNCGLGSGYGGDGSAATSAQFDDPTGVAVDGAGRLFVADSGNNVIREVAGPLYWNPGQTGTADAGGAGAWTPGGNDKCWYDPLVDADVTWSDGSDAIFSGNAGTVTLSGTASPASMIFETGGYVVANAAPSDGLMLPPAGVSFDVEGGSATIDAPIAGSGTLIVSGSGRLALDGVDTNSGGTDLKGGTLQLGEGATLGSGCLIVDAGTLDLNGQSVTVGLLESNTGAGLITNNSATTSTLTVDQDGNAGYFGGIQGAICLVLAGSGALVADGNNAFSGGTTVASGLFVVASADSLPAGTDLAVGADGASVFDASQACALLDSGQACALLNSGQAPALQAPVSAIAEPVAGGTPRPPDPAPVVTAIECLGRSLVDADSVTFGVTFSVQVTGVAPGDFAVDGLGGTVTSVSGSSSSYKVTVNLNPGGGAAGLHLVHGGTIADWFGTPLNDGATIPDDQQYTIDRQLYWDASGGSGPAGGSGAWAAGNYNWHVGSPAGPLQEWVDGSDALFAGAPGTVTVAGAVEATSITVLSDGYVLQDGTIFLASPQTAIDVAAGSATIDCRLGGNALLKNGAGTLFLGGTNAYASSMTIDAGALSIRGASAVPPGTAVTVRGGILDLGGATLAQLTTVTLTGGGIIDGAVEVDTALYVYGGTILADMGGTASLDKLGPGTVVLVGDNTYSGGTNVLDGTLVSASASSLPGAAVGPGTVLLRPTLYWSGSGDWTTGPWQLADGTRTPWIDGSSVVIAAGSRITLSGAVHVTAVSIAGDATVDGGALWLSSAPIAVACGSATISSTLAGDSGLVKTGAGTLVLDGTLAYAGMTTVVGGTLDLQSPLAAAPLVLAGQAIGPGAVFSADDTPLYDLDPAMFDLVQSLFVDRAIDRGDMIQILRSAVVDGQVTRGALGALETLTMPRNETRLNVPGYVAVLAGDVVNGNPANADYQGQPLGILAGQATDQLRGTALVDLVNKWFYGTDLPAVPAWLSYNVVAGSLFGGNPDPSLALPSSADMAQGGLGDCYLIAALGALADSSPAAIENTIIPNGVENGIASWSVRFCYQESSGAYVADYVTVNALLPGYSSGTVAYAHPGPNGSWWIPIIEKAYAQWNETGREGRDGRDDYESLAGGCMNVVNEQVLGAAATTYSPATSNPTAKQALIAAIQNHAAVTAAIFTNGDAKFNQLGLVPSHAYDIVGYDADPTSPTFDTFQLNNPWGYDEPAPLTWNELRVYCGWFAVAAASAANASGEEIAGGVSSASGSPLHAGDVLFPMHSASRRDSPASARWQDSQRHGVEMILAESERPSSEPVAGDVVDKAILKYLDSVDATFDGNNIGRRRPPRSYAP